MRDDFTKGIVDILGKRVGYLCSNPQCRTHTIGPNTNDNKSSTIGIAAHISAASIGGPRYNAEMTADERKDIKNGIWLCSNCATLIDKDPEKFDVETLINWKRGAEEEMDKKMLASKNIQIEPGQPFIEVEFVAAGMGRRMKWYSENNPKEIIDGVESIIVSGTPNIQYELFWKYKLRIVNNSEFPAFNISIIQTGNPQFNTLTTLPKINSLKPLDEFVLDAQYKIDFEGNRFQADALILREYTSVLDGLQFEIKYRDSKGNSHTQQYTIKEGELIYVH